MRNNRRYRLEGATWFFTVVAHGRRHLFCAPEFRNALKFSIIRCRERLPFAIRGWVLMPDHLHCIWTLPKGDSDYSKRWMLIKQAVTVKLLRQGFVSKNLKPLRRSGREGTVWQRRFWDHLIRDPEDFQAHLDYIHYNPVKHGHCLSPNAWPFSTIHRYRRLGVYPENWAIDPERSLSGIHSFGEAEYRRRT